MNIFCFGKKVEETRGKINAAADEAAQLSKEARDHIDQLHKQIDDLAAEARETTKRFEKKADDAANELRLAEKIKIGLLGVIAIASGIIAVNSCRD